MLVEKTLASKKRPFPSLFQEIIKNDEQLRLTKSSPVVDITAYRQQMSCKREYMKSAEKIYAGTKNKGTEI